MADDPNWAEILSAIGTTMTGSVAAFYSWRVYILERQRLHGELTPPRRELHARFADLSLRACRATHPKHAASGAALNKSDIDELNKIQINALPLFSGEIVHDIREFNAYLYFYDVREPNIDESVKLFELRQKILDGIEPYFEPPSSWIEKLGWVLGHSILTIRTVKRHLTFSRKRNRSIHKEE